MATDLTYRWRGKVDLLLCVCRGEARCSEELAVRGRSPVLRTPIRGVAVAHRSHFLMKLQTVMCFLSSTWGRAVQRTSQDSKESGTFSFWEIHRKNPAFSTLGSLMSSDLPLTRRQHEMITTFVSRRRRPADQLGGLHFYKCGQGHFFMLDWFP